MKTGALLRFSVEAGAILADAPAQARAVKSLVTPRQVFLRFRQAASSFVKPCQGFP
jgi:hypothetical protein